MSLKMKWMRYGFVTKRTASKWEWMNERLKKNFICMIMINWKSCVYKSERYNVTSEGRMDRQLSEQSRRVGLSVANLWYEKLCFFFLLVSSNSLLMCFHDNLGILWNLFVLRWKKVNNVESFIIKSKRK